MKPVFRAFLAASFAVAWLLVMAGSGKVLAAEDSTPAKKKVTQSPSYVMVEPIYASILEGQTPRGLLLVEIGLDVPDEGMRGQVQHALPLLRDAYVRSLVIYAGTAVRAWRQPDIEDIDKRLQAITDHIMGRAGAQVLMAQTAIRITK